VKFTSDKELKIHDYPTMESAIDAFQRLKEISTLSDASENTKKTCIQAINTMHFFEIIEIENQIENPELI
jgi:DNA modification methylase